MLKTLIIDGDNLLTIGFYGEKNKFNKGVHIGGLFHFINTLRINFDRYHLDKIVVFWDGNEAKNSRKKIYPWYKENRVDKFKTEEEKSSYEYQRNRVKLYLEEIYVRQAEFDYCESDDCIAYYVLNSPNEKKIIYSSDGDLTQLLNEQTQIYNPSFQKIFNKNDKILYKKEEILINNIRLLKILCGDASDNISGIYSLGIKKLLKFFPEMRERELTLDYILFKANEIFEENKHNKTINNLLTGVTKRGVFGEEFFVINSKIINLDNPILTEDAKQGVLSLINDDLDPEGRSYKNTLKMMMEDGLFNVLPKSDDAWTKFLNPFLKLTRKEKNKKKN